MIRTTRSCVGGFVDNRYHYDWRECRSGRWAQMDTGQDAPWFGQWANPFERRILCYAEGDQTLTECSTDAEFVAELERIAAFHRENDEWKKIDPWTAELYERFAEAGAAHLVHRSCREWFRGDRGAEACDTPREGLGA